MLSVLSVMLTFASRISMKRVFTKFENWRKSKNNVAFA